jgi:hypothetical protein
MVRIFAKLITANTVLMAIINLQLEAIRYAIPRAQLERRHDFAYIWLREHHFLYS